MAARPVSSPTDTAGGITQSRPVTAYQTGDHARSARRRGEQPDAQEAARQGEPECHGECDQRSVELLPLGEMCRHARWVTRRHRCVKLAPATANSRLHT